MINAVGHANVVLRHLLLPGGINDDDGYPKD